MCKMEIFFAHTNVDGKMEGRQFRTVLFSTAIIFHVGAWIEREIDMICTTLDTGVYRVVSAVSVDFSRYIVSDWYEN